MFETPAGLAFNVDPHEFAHLTGFTLTGIVLKRQKGEWLLVVKAITRSGDPVVAFTSGDSIGGIWGMFVELQGTRYARGAWLKDKYANRSK